MPKDTCRKSMISQIHAEWCNLDLTNKVLLLIGLVLLVELILSIFLHAFDIDTTTDAFFRLSLSSVLGYFLGGINTGTNSTETTGKVETPIVTVGKTKEETEMEMETPAQNFQQATYIRTIFVAFVCLVCIATLAVTTFLNQTGYEEGLIQLRNIVSTTLGFLISKANRRS